MCMLRATVMMHNLLYKKLLIGKSNGKPTDLNLSAPVKPCPTGSGMTLISMLVTQLRSQIILFAAMLVKWAENLKD